MKKFRIFVAKKDEPSPKGRSDTAKSNDIDKKIVSIGTTVNMFNKYTNVLQSKMYIDPMDGIIYLPVIYVETLRCILMQMYEKSDDPIAQGYKNKGDLEFTMEFVKDMYHDEQDRKMKIVNKAAFILYNIASKPPFTDGNKRSAIITCNSFLEYNGYTAGNLPFSESYRFITGVAAGKYNEIDCQKFIKNHINKIEISKEFFEVMKTIKKIVHFAQLRHRRVLIK